jgi:general secretion pathway protein G
MRSLDRIPIGVVRSGLPGPADRCGFTLVELLIAVCASAILVAVAIGLYGNSIYKAQVQAAVRDVGVLQARIEKYHSDNNAYPTTLADLNLPATDTTDPWGFQYEYINHDLVSGKGKIRRDRSLNPLNSDYDLYSVGRDGDSKFQLTAKESQDDVVRALSGAYIGLASDF